MHISVPKTIKLAFFALAFTLFLTSCKKENSDVIKEEVTETIMKITIGSRTYEKTAYATYCAANGKVFLNVSNNKVLLDSAVLSNDFVVDDFLLFYEKEGTQVSTLGGASFTENVGGTPITSVVFDPAATIVIDQANSQFVQGSMTGKFQLLNGTMANYSVQFKATVIRVSPFCN